MHVETAVTVPKATMRDPECRRRLEQEARARLTDLGVAAGALDEEPAIVVTQEPAPSSVVTVTFAWESG